MYGDDVFQSLINTVGYRKQSLHHTLVFKSRKVLFVTTGRNEVIYMTKQVKLYKVLLKIFLKAPDLDSFRIYRTFADNKLSDESLATNGYHLGIYSVKLQFYLWKNLNQIVLHNKLISACLKISPSGITLWNNNKVYIDVMSRLLSHIKIPFKKADPVLQLIVRFTFILLVNGYITTKLTKNISRPIFEDDNITFDDIKNKLCQFE